MADSGVLQRLHHGIYRLAHIPYDGHLAERVAWFALDQDTVVWDRLDQAVPTGVLSHRTAAALHQLGDMDADEVELSAPRRIRLSVPHVIVHRAQLNRDDWQIVDGLPVTTPIRTIGDLAAASTDAGHLATVVRDALTRDLATTEEAAAALAPHAFAYGHRPLGGQTFLDALIEEAGVPETTLAVAEIADPRMRSVAESLRSVSDLGPRVNAQLLRSLTPTLDTLRDINAYVNSPAFQRMADIVAAQASLSAAADLANAPALEALLDSIDKMDPTTLETLRNVVQHASDKRA